MIDELIGQQNELQSALIIMQRIFNTWMKAPADIRRELHPVLLEAIDAYHATRKQLSNAANNAIKTFEYED